MYHDTTFKLQSTNSSQEFALHNWDIFYGISIGCVDSFRILITGSSDSSFGESFTLAIYETETFKVSPVSLSNMYQAPVPKHICPTCMLMCLLLTMFQKYALYIMLDFQWSADYMLHSLLQCCLALWTLRIRRTKFHYIIGMSFAVALQKFNQESFCLPIASFFLPISNSI